MEYSKKYYEENKDKFKQRYLQNKQKKLEYQKIYNIINADKVKEYQRSCWEKHKSNSFGAKIKTTLDQIKKENNFIINFD